MSAFSTIPDDSTAGIDGLAFDSGDVFFALGQQDDNDLYTVDQSTGALSLIGATGFTQVSGIAFLEVNGTPEPGTLGLLGLGLGLAGLAGSRGRKQQASTFPRKPANAAGFLLP